MLEELAGRWEGDGTTYEDSPFRGTLDLEPLAGGRGLAVEFKAVATDGAVLFRHRGILAGDRLAFLDDAHARDSGHFVEQRLGKIVPVLAQRADPRLIVQRHRVGDRAVAVKHKPADV